MQCIYVQHKGIFRWLLPHRPFSSFLVPFEIETLSSFITDSPQDIFFTRGLLSLACVSFGVKGELVSSLV